VNRFRLQADAKKSAVLDLTKHVDQRVRVKFTGGREGNTAGSYYESISLFWYSCSGCFWYSCSGSADDGFSSVEGRLKGFDTLVNLVLDDCVEYIRGLNPAPYVPSCFA
jgi:small nuclear ribonucleoprotein (snRNP)-like protein